MTDSQRKKMYRFPGRRFAILAAAALCLLLSILLTGCAGQEAGFSISALSPAGQTAGGSGRIDPSDGIIPSSSPITESSEDASKSSESEVETPGAVPSGRPGSSPESSGASPDTESAFFPPNTSPDGFYTSEAILSFSTYDGGESIYKITIADPEIVACSGGQGYTGPGQSLVSGVGYRDYYVFTGLKPGTTTVTASANSLISGNYEIRYIAAVDENLKISLRRAQSISAFDLLRIQGTNPRRYQITIVGEDYYLSLDEGMYKKISRDTVDALYQVCEEFGVFLWNGFCESSNDTADTAGRIIPDDKKPDASGDIAFTLSITLTDGYTIQAEGKEVFPSNYSEAVDVIEDVLKHADYQRMISISGLLDWLTSDPQSTW